MKGFLFVAALMALGFFADAINAEAISSLWGLLFIVPGVVAFLYLLREVIE